MVDPDDRRHLAVADVEDLLGLEKLERYRVERLCRDRRLDSHALLEQVRENGEPPAGEHAVAAEGLRLPAFDARVRPGEPVVVVALRAEDLAELGDGVHGASIP